MSSELDLAWEDVLRRAKRRAPRRRLVLAAVVAIAALGGGPAVAVLLTQPPGPHLPKAADRSNVAVILQPKTGKILIEAAPWKGHDGVCYLILGREDGCATWSPHGAYFDGGTPSGYTFDERVRSVTAEFADGKSVRLMLHRFERLRITFFTSARFRAFVRTYTFRDASGNVISRTRLPGPRKP
jgi:hypothetical protein